MKEAALVEHDRGPRTADTEFVRQMVADLWPTGVVEIRTRPRRRRLPAGSVELVVLPSLGRPRLLIPRGSVRGSASAIRTYKTSASGLARRKVQLLAAPTRLGLARLHPHVVTVSPSGGNLVGLDRHLSEVLGEDLVCSIHIGPSRAVRKPVLQLLTRQGLCVAFAKVGINPLTRDLVEREATTLSGLKSATWDCVQPPDVLFQGTWNNLAVLALGALVPAGSQPVTERLRTTAMLEVAEAAGIRTATLRESAYFTALTTRVRSLPPSPEASLLTTALASVAARAGQVEVRFGAWHGDWTPWNMAANGQRLLLWDWEHFEVGVPVGFDALHHAVNSAVREGGSVRRAFRETRLAAPSLLAPFQDAEPAAALTTTLYVIDIASRYARDGEIEAGSALGDLPRWLEHVLVDQHAQPDQHAIDDRR